MTRPPWLICVVAALFVPTPPARADDYPQWLGPRRDNVYRETGIVETFPATGLKTLWRAPVGGGYSQVAVAGDKVVATDRNAAAGTERVLCFDDATGNLLWKVEYDCPYTISYSAGPRTTPTIEGDRVYTLGAEGHLYCIDLSSGKPLWHKKLPGKPAMWGYAASPLIEGDLLIVLSSGRPLLTALHKATGEVAWKALEVADPGYSPPTLVTLSGGRRQIVQYHPTGVAAVDPTDGRVLWQLPYGPENNGVTIVTPVQLDPETILLTSHWTGMAAIRVPPDNAARFLWHVRGKGRAITTLQALHSQMALHEGHVYGVHNTGALVCVDASNGRAVWSDPRPLLGDTAERVQWGTAFLVPWRPDPAKPAKHFFLATDGGDLILCDLSPTGYREISRTHLLDPTNRDGGRPALWCNPSYAHRSVYWRNDKELIRVSLDADRGN